MWRIVLEYKVRLFYKFCLCFYILLLIRTHMDTLKSRRVMLFALILLVVSIFVLIFAVVASQSSEESNPINDSALANSCKQSGGHWLEESMECEGVTMNRCIDLGGIYNECASACRNDANAEMCTLQCVQVCKF